MLDEQYVRELALRRGSGLVTSFYLDVDGRRYPRRSDYQPHAATLCHAARRRAAARGEEAVAGVDGDIDRIGRWLADGVDRTTTRGIALFCCTRDGWFEALPLPAEVRDQVTVAPEPDVAQLLAMLEHRRRTLVALTDRHEARLFRVELGVVEERPSVRDERERRVDTDVEVGGWARRRDEQARRHFRRVAAAIHEEVRHWQPNGVLLAAAPGDVSALRAHLDRAVAGLVIGSIPLAITASRVDVGVAALEIARDVEERREHDLVDALHHDAPNGGKAALGLAAVMAALAQGRVATLVVARDFEAVGARCPACGHVGVATCQCPECGTPSVEADDIVEVAIREALAQNAAVEFCTGTDLASLGGIGAVERF